MRAIVYSRTGDSSVLSLQDREPALPGPGEVRVRVVVSGVNPTDWKTRADADQVAPTGETVPNIDGAGVVESVGAGVTGLEPGDRVWVYLAQPGTAAEYAVVPAAHAVRLPSGAGFEVGASLGVPAMTAHRALTVHQFGPARLSPGALADRVVLVQGGAGAVGHAAIQLARWAGATVIATVSSEAKAGLARAAGADHVVTYPDDSLADRIRELAPDGVDHIVEVAAATNATLDLEVLAVHGTVAVYADTGGDSFTVVSSRSAGKNIRWQALLLYTLGEDLLAAAAEDLTAALTDGALPVGTGAGLPLTWFDLPETAAAHDAVQSGTTGKVLIRVAPDGN